MEQSGEQWLDWQREGLAEKKKRNKTKGERQLQTKEEMHNDSTYIWIVSSHDVSNDNGSIFKFEL